MKTFLGKITGITTMIVTGIILTGSSASYQKTGGNSKNFTQERELSHFDGIEVSGAMEIILIQGDKEKVIIEANESLMDRIHTKVKGTSLHIYTKDIETSEDIKITVMLKDLNELEISGAVNLTTDGMIKTTNLEIDCSGAAKMDMELVAQSIECDFSGGTKITMKGNTHDLEMDISGAAKVSAFEMKAVNCEFDISGAAKAEISCNEKLEVEVSGTAKIVYKGDPQVQQSVSGVASVSPYKK
jgi:Putative auto-transporter adhesin, head GIN domain